MHRVTLREQNRDRLRRVVGVIERNEWYLVLMTDRGKGGGGKRNFVGRMLGGMKSWRMLGLG